MSATTTSFGSSPVRLLDGTGLSEPQWVTLRLAAQAAPEDDARLTALVTDRAHRADAEALVAALTERVLNTVVARGREALATLNEGR